MKTKAQPLAACGLAVAGWAYCGALVGVGRQFLPMDQTLIVHAVGAPIGFALLSWVYHRLFAAARPLVTSVVFLSIVVGLDLVVVAPFVEKSFAMFRSLIGTWIPFVLIFAVTYLTGRWTQSRR